MILVLLIGIDLLDIRSDETALILCLS
jgi:hypothetical protein